MTKTYYPSWLVRAHGADEHSQNEDPAWLSPSEVPWRSCSFLLTGLKDWSDANLLELHERLGAATRLPGSKLHVDTPVCISGVVDSH